MVDAVLLEWEGVLADTGAARRDALVRALADEGVPLDPAAYDACCGGLDVRAAARAALARAGRSDPTLAEIVALRAGRAFAERLVQGFSLLPYASSFVASAEPRARLAIVTRAARAETELFLRLAGLESMFGCVVTADEVLDLPPAPELYDHALAQLARRRGVQRGRTLALASAVAPIQAARAAGVPVLAVGAPAHVALEADGAMSDLGGATLGVMAALAGMTSMERPA